MRPSEVTDGGGGLTLRSGRRLTVALAPTSPGFLRVHILSVAGRHCHKWILLFLFFPPTNEQLHILEEVAPDGQLLKLSVQNELQLPASLALSPTPSFGVM